MLCSYCNLEITTKTLACPYCGVELVPPDFPPNQEAPLPDDGMKAEYNGQTFTQYYREPFSVSMPRREGRRTAQVQPSVAHYTPRRGRSLPPTTQPAPEAAAPEHAGRIYGAGDQPTGPIYVRRPKERTVHASTQRKVTLRRRGPRLGVIMLSVVVLLSAVIGVSFYLLTHSAEGQLILAAWGVQNAPIDAYWRLGESKIREGYVPEALQAFETAYEMDSENVDGCLMLANAYERDGQVQKAVEIYQKLIEETAPEHPAAYTRMAQMYQEEGKHAEAVAMMELGLEKTGLETFTAEIRKYSPDSPYPTVIGKRDSKDIRMTIKATSGMKILYTLDGNDPWEAGIEYDGSELVFSEGTTQVRAVAVQENGVPSKEMNETYTVQYPTPDAPHANVASGTYDYAPTVGIFPSDASKKSIVAIHYTVDGTPVTTQSPLYTGPFKLRTGKTTLRAIAVDDRGKVSYEMSATYKVKGTVKKMFNQDDGFDKLVIMKTTYEQFVRAYGEPNKYEQIEVESDEKLFRADYGFGYACFVQVDASGKALLYELMVESGKIKGPRSISIGTDEDKVLAAFRDIGSQPNDKGERALYNNDVSSIGVYQLEDNGNFAAHYYYQRAQNDYVELAFYFERGTVARMHWLRYVGE